MSNPTKRIVLLVLSVAAGFGVLVSAWHWAIFLVGGVTVTLCVYFFGIQLSRVVRNLKIKNFKVAFKYFIYSIALVVLSGLVWLISIGSGVFTGAGIPHLRTNIFTGECSLNQWNDQADAWYYRRGCDVSTEEKIQLLKSDYRFEFLQVRCGASDDYGGNLKWGEVTCADLLE